MPDLGGGPLSVERFTGRKTEDEEFEGGEQDAFCRARIGRGQVHMVEFRDGDDSQALGFPWLAKADKMPGGMLLDFGTHTVAISGRDLGELYEAVITHRLRWVRVGGPGEKFKAVVRGIVVAAREE